MVDTAMVLFDTGVDLGTNLFLYCVDQMFVGQMVFDEKLWNHYWIWDLNISQKKM